MSMEMSNNADLAGQKRMSILSIADDEAYGCVTNSHAMMCHTKVMS